mmetsp:Transcript_5302/g.15558  ORF Transcript_5302/g.15558 Transcript_5302/m.15558 type:complete len:378 (-) Transcript_5302:273-1406(-)
MRTSGATPTRTSLACCVAQPKRRNELRSRRKGSSKRPTGKSSALSLSSLQTPGASRRRPIGRTTRKACTRCQPCRSSKASRLLLRGKFLTILSMTSKRHSGSTARLSGICWIRVVFVSHTRLPWNPCGLSWRRKPTRWRRLAMPKSRDRVVQVFLGSRTSQRGILRSSTRRLWPEKRPSTRKSWRARPAENGVSLNSWKITTTGPTMWESRGRRRRTSWIGTRPTTTCGRRTACVSSPSTWLPSRASLARCRMQRMMGQKSQAKWKTVNSLGRQVKMSTTGTRMIANEIGRIKRSGSGSDPGLGLSRPTLIRTTTATTASTRSPRRRRRKRIRNGAETVRTVQGTPMTATRNVIATVPENVLGLGLVHDNPELHSCT